MNLRSERAILTITRVLRSANIVQQRRFNGRTNRAIIGGSLLRHVSFDVRGRDNILEIGDMCRLRNLHLVVRRNGNRIVIGSAVRVNNRLDLWVDGGSTIVVGPRTTVESAHLAATERTKLTIGEDCMIASDVEVRTGDSHSLLTADGTRVNPARTIAVEDHVWLATRSMILKGVHLHSNTTVAAGSIVTRSTTTSGEVLAGSPAQQVRSETTWHRDRL